jgi:hypothetical protein
MGGSFLVHYFQKANQHGDTVDGGTSIGCFDETDDLLNGVQAAWGLPAGSALLRRRTLLVLNT